MNEAIDFKKIEEKWINYWREQGTYSFDEKDSKKPVYSIDSPPPFTSGALHMGHVLSYAYFDFAARYKRMKGFNVYYPQGWDCQGFPTEIKVEQKYGRGLSREDFLKKCMEFTEENIAKMKSQMLRMGFSPDWHYEYKTMDADYHRRVQYSLLKMYSSGLVYREKHPVLFCTHCNSAIAKAETEDIERETKLNFIKFKCQETGENILIATTRPEFLNSCVAVFVNPSDERHKNLIGKHAIVPLYERVVKIIADPDVDTSFGTGVVMVCTYGDKTDVVWAHRHNLEVIEAMNERGEMISSIKELNGLKAEVAREKTIEILSEKGLVEKQERLRQVVKIHDRCSRPVEFILSWQWFIKVKDFKEEIIAAAKKMRWIPEFSIQYLIDWCEGLEWDWVISRQRFYGTPIPFWYCSECGKIFVPSEKKLPVYPFKQELEYKYCECGGIIKGEESTCDCWVDSSITPLVIGKWPDDDFFLKKVYPVSLRPQGIEIIRTWAFYSIYRCLKLSGRPCFKDVLINGNVLGKDGKKMSKSAGNFEDPEILLQKYPADALRQWAALSGAFAKDRPFNYKEVERGQAFLIKLINASRFVEKASNGFKEKERNELNLKIVDLWILSKLNKLIKKCNQAMDSYDYFETISSIHEFFWNEFCDYYLEEVKYRIYSGVLKEEAVYTLKTVLESVLRLLAPITPFITEELYQKMFPGKGSIHKLNYPVSDEKMINESIEEIAEILKSVLSEVRKFKVTKGLSLGQDLASIKIFGSKELIEKVARVEDEIKAVGRIGVVLAEVTPGKELSIELRL